MIDQKVADIVEKMSVKQPSLKYMIFKNAFGVYTFGTQKVKVTL